MKKKLLYVAFAAIFSFVVLSSRTNGPAFMGVGNRTGSPGSSGTCSSGSCHSGTTYTNVAISMQVKNSFGAVVTSYRPGQSYTLEYTCTASGSPVGFGMQATILKSNNTSAGTMTAALTANTRVVTGQYVEHSNVQTNGIFRATWTAPAAGTGNLTMYGITLAVNDNNNDNGDVVGPSTQYAIAEDITNINYTQTTYCQTAADPSANLVGTAGGTFTASPAGLSINASTGVIDVSASTVGNYTITYTYSGGETVTDAVTISAVDVAAINYTNTSYCQTAADPSANLTGTTGGIFSASPAGLSINATTGLVDVSASAAGNYTISYTTTGVCPTTTTDNLTITATDVAGINYTNTSYCQNASDPAANLTGATGGTFSASPAGLSISASTGLVDVSASTVGTYTISYTTAGTCPTTVTDAITITAQDVASINYNASYCQNTADATANLTGAAGGTFTASPAGLSIDATTGVVDVSASAAGTYSIEYTSAGTCSVTVSDNITVEATNDAAFAYAGLTYCQTGTDPTPTLNGSLGGVFSASPAGLSINAADGTVDLASSAVGSYLVEYQTTGTCPDTFSTSFDITATGDAGFSYANDSICNDLATAAANITGIAGGVFSANSGDLVFADALGTIDVAASMPGVYTVTYTVSGNCAATSDMMLTILATDVASLSYTQSSYCPNQGIISPSNLSAGVLTASPNGLSLDANNGAIDLAASAAGTYTVLLTTQGYCAATTSTTVVVNAEDVADFSYTNNTFCVNLEPNAVATINGTTGGTFSADNGLAINATTGEIDFSTFPSGVFVVQYITAGACPDTMSTSLTLDICAGVNALSSANNLRLYPNPNKGIFHLKNEGKPAAMQVWVFDALGKIHLQQKAVLSTGESLPLQLQNIEKGIYFVKVQLNGETKTLKMSVE